MRFQEFKLERYFSAYEFKVDYVLSASDCESLSMAEVLQLADPETLDWWQHLELGYTESQGHPFLRAEIAQLYRDVAPDDVLEVVPEEGILIAMGSILEAGDHAIVASPGYQSLHEVARALGCSVTTWPLEARGSGWRLDLGALRDSLTPATRLIVVNFPHNPTGYSPQLDDFVAILNLARERDLYLFSDEMYRLLEYDPADRLPAGCDLYEKCISLSGLSKSFALPGLRVGWLATRDRALMARMARFKDYTTICASAPGEVLGVMALRARDRILARNLGIIEANLEVAEQFFARQTGYFSWIAPQAGSVAFPKWRGDGPVEQFCQDVLERKSVLVVPGSIFDFAGDHFRLGLGRRNLPEALARVEEYLHERRNG